MTTTINTQLIQNVVIAVGFIGGLILYTRNRIPQKNVKEQGELIATLQELRLADTEKANKNLALLKETYEKRIGALEDELKTNHSIQLQNVAAIADLQGQIKIYKELPLQDLADGIKQNNDISTEILNSLKHTAEIAAEDRDVLTNQNKHIRDEVNKINEANDGL